MINKEIKDIVDSILIDIECLDESKKLQLDHQIKRIVYILQKQIENRAGYLEILSDFALDSLEISENIKNIIKLERKYKEELKNWNQYLEWKNNRNPKRAILEEKFGYDCKHAAHCVRLFRECAEILKTGTVIVKRPDAEELLAIKNNGIWTFEQLEEFVEKQDKIMDELIKTSSLPKDPPYKQLDDICRNFIEEVNYANI